MTLSTLNSIAISWIGLAIAVHVTMFFIKAPFGRHTSTKYGRSINNKWGWFLMELPSLLIMSYFLFFGTRSLHSFTWILFLMWILHYLNRTVIYPLRIKSTDKKMPIFIVLNAVIFNLFNAGLNGYFLAELADGANYSAAWLSSPHFIIGSSLFFIGMAINWTSDTLLIGLRKKEKQAIKSQKDFYLI